MCKSKPQPQNPLLVAPNYFGYSRRRRWDKSGDWALNSWGMINYCRAHYMGFISMAALRSEFMAPNRYSLTKNYCLIPLRGRRRRYGRGAPWWTRSFCQTHTHTPTLHYRPSPPSPLKAPVARIPFQNDDLFQTPYNLYPEQRANCLGPLLPG